MTRPRLARLATDLLANERLATRAPSIDAEARAVDAIAAAIRARARRRRRIWLVSGVAAAAGLMLAAGSALMQLTHPPSQMTTSPTLARTVEPVSSGAGTDAATGAVATSTSVSAPLAPSATVRLGERLVAAKESVAFVLADASQIILDAESEVTVANLSATRRFHLSRGALRANVTKLGPGERFVVETEDTEVEVHGTSFRVALASESESRFDTCTQAHTRVTVFEGVVAVRWHGTEERVSAGNAWPHPCAEHPTGRAPASPLPSVSRPSAPPAPSSELTAPAAPLPPPPPPQGNGRALAEQNQLFADASAARRSGNAAAAIAGYEQLLARYPDSFLAESAMVERMRMLDSVDHGRARAAAADYLARYPKGFARQEAERLAGR